MAQAFGHNHHSFTANRLGIPSPFLARPVIEARGQIVTRTADEVKTDSCLVRKTPATNRSVFRSDKHRLASNPLSLGVQEKPRLESWFAKSGCRHLGAALLLCVVLLCIYHPVLRFEYLYHDDWPFFKQR